jgi:DHA2 family multidrug resistance protein
MNSVRREQVSEASSMLTVIMQVGGAFGVALLGATLQRREFFHYAQYLQQFDNAFSPQLAKAQALMQELLLRQGVSPAEAVVKGKSLLVLWVQKQAAVSAFGDVFVFAAALIAIGIVPALLIRRIRPAQPSQRAAIAERKMRASSSSFV